MKLYVIGPVTGLDDLNRPAFEAARTVLEAEGYVALLPHDFIAADATWQQAMKRSLETLAKADGVACLDGWSKSHGASHEVETAQWLGLPAMSVKDWIDPSCSLRVIEEATETKLCPKCKRVIPLTLFNKSAHTFDGLQAYCRDCMNTYKRERL